MKKEIKEELVPDGQNGYWFKDKDGVVWQIRRTPYKEIPIIYINWAEKFKIGNAQNG